MFNSHGRTYYYPGSYTNNYGVSSATYSTGGDRLFGDQLSVEFVGSVLFDNRDYTSTPMGTYSSIGSSVGSSVGSSIGSACVDVLQSSLPSISSASYATDDRMGGRPGSGATGELNPDYASPVGDVLIPMLLMVGVYTIVRLWRNRKLLFKIK